MRYCGQGRLPVASSVSPIDATLSSTQVKTGLEPGSKPKWGINSERTLCLLK